MTRKLDPNKSMSFRPGALAGPIEDYCEANECTPSDLIRRAIARLLKVDEPDMPRGDPGASRKTALRANKARWGK